MQPKPGYAYYWEGWEKVCPRTQDWDITVLLESELAGLEYRGTRCIDGVQCAIFYAGELPGDRGQRYYAQTVVFCQGRKGDGVAKDA